MRGGFAPGDVGITAGGTLALRRRTDPDGWIDSHGAPWSTTKFPANVRALVVIDPEDEEQVGRLTRAYWDGGGGPGVAGMRAALRSLIAPPGPPEPQGLGAVVESNDGRRWVRCEPDGGIAKWLLSQAPEHSDPRYVWSAVPAVRVLSEGVTG